jgi:hypothetical protein
MEYISDISFIYNDLNDFIKDKDGLIRFKYNQSPFAFNIMVKHIRKNIDAFFCLKKNTLSFFKHNELFQSDFYEYFFKERFPYIEKFKQNRELEEHEKFFILQKLNNEDSFVHLYDFILKNLIHDHFRQEGLPYLFFHFSKKGRIILNFFESVFLIQNEDFFIKFQNSKDFLNFIEPQEYYTNKEHFYHNSVWRDTIENQLQNYLPIEKTYELSLLYKEVTTND